MTLHQLNSSNLNFPALNTALKDPNGLLAVGGDLSPARLIEAYKQAVFPWYSKGEPILWWSPNPRAVLFPADFKISRRLQQKFKQSLFTVTTNQAFSQVVSECSKPRAQQAETWITSEMQAAYIELHRLGHAMSVEVWCEQRLVGGLYGVVVNQVFCGESMFSRESDASKFALNHILNHMKNNRFSLIDCQIMNPHLKSLGAKDVSREQFLALLKTND